MKRGYPFQQKQPAQRVEMQIDLDQENLRNCFAVGQVLGKEPSEIANLAMRIGFLRLHSKRLEEETVMHLIASQARTAAEALPQEKPKEEEDSMTPEERLAENRKLAGL